MSLKLTLTPKTRKGKNVITNHGDQWFIVRHKETVQFSSERFWMIIQSKTTDDIRWVRDITKQQIDKDFEIHINR